MNKIIAYEITTESFNSEKYLAFLIKNKDLYNPKGPIAIAILGHEK